MKCPECQLEGTRSTVTPGMAMTTLMGYSPGYYDEDGKWIANRNPNWTTTSYMCSAGHYFDIVTRDGDPDRVRLHGFGAGAGCTYYPPQPVTLEELRTGRKAVEASLPVPQTPETP